MRILVLGAGAIGGYYGLQLAQGGAEVLGSTGTYAYLTRAGGGARPRLRRTAWAGAFR